MKRLIAIGAIAASCVACSNDYYVDFSYISDAPPSVLIDRDSMEIPAGIAVGVKAFPMEDDRREDAALDLVAARPGIIGIDSSLEEDTWVVFGSSPGVTEVEVWFDGELVGEIPARVTEQHTSPR